jgi:hypothetical protein
MGPIQIIVSSYQVLFLGSYYKAFVFITLKYTTYYKSDPMQQAGKGKQV